MIAATPFGPPVLREVRRPRIVPQGYVLLSNWRYVEYGILRIIAGWGRAAGDWEDKLAVCRHVWHQAEVVDRMRRRLDMFPGGKKDGPVDVIFEHILNASLLAPNFANTMAGVRVLQEALTQTYLEYSATNHPVHDLPTFDLLREVIAMKRIQMDWHDDFIRRHPASIDPNYIEKIREMLATVGNFAAPIEPSEEAQLCGKRTEFLMDITPGRPKGWNQSPDVVPLLEMNWAHSVEARRLYFMIAYMREMGVAEEQLRWIYYADFMPFEYIHAEARHMWDESRHGDSGLHRLRDFGLDLSDVYYDSYGRHGEGKLPAMTPSDVYNAFYSVTQIAETGFFEAKRYCFEDFGTGGDEASEEMMQFDIIDETSHVEYGRLWLEKMARRAGVIEDYRARGRADRLLSQQRSDARVASLRWFSKTGQTPESLGIEINNPCLPPMKSMEESCRLVSDPKSRKHYEWLLSELRGQLPLKNVDAIPARPNLPL